MSELVFIILFLSFLIHRVNTNFFVILLQSSHVFSGFREFTFFHTLSNVPVHKSTLGIHKIKLMIQTSPSFSNCCGVAQHAYSSLNLGQITTWYDSGITHDLSLDRRKSDWFLSYIQILSL